ncbi:MAG: hypothetical protein ACK5KT_04195 [Dysgonomonas sp.]
MQKITFLFSLLLILSAQVKGQKGSDFNIQIPDVKVGDSRYNNLRYIESRPNPDDMGLVYTGMWNGIQPVMLTMPIESQFQSLYRAISFSSGEPKTIALQMRAFFFSLGEKDMKGKAKCNLRMTLYEMDVDEKYYFLNTIDTLLVNDQKKIKGAVSEVISNFIIANLPYYAEEGEAPLDMAQVMGIDFYEKNSIPFYTEELLPDGIYANYKSLKNLSPDISSNITVVKTDRDGIKEIKIPDIGKPGKYKKLKAKDIYAIVADGIPYISFEGDLYKAYKKDNDWRFVITQKVPGSGFSLGVSVGTSGSRGGGAVGLGIPIGGKKENIEMFVDHLNGDIYWGGKVKE